MRASALIGIAAMIILAGALYEPDPAEATGVADIAVGGSHTCAILQSGAVKCWGDNSDGQLGIGSPDPSGHSLPEDVPALGTDTVALAAGGDHACRLNQVGAVECWGDNRFGQLGDGTTTDRYSPTAVSGLSQDVVDIDAGDKHTCAVLASGTLKCWGRNFSGQLGDGTTTDRPSPVIVTGLGSITSVTVGSGHTCALSTSGQVSCWGDNVTGQLGDDQGCGRSCPVPVSPIGLGSVASVVAGGLHTCAVTKTGGAKCWGSDSNGELGDGSVCESFSCPTPIDVLGLTNNVLALSARSSQTCAVLTDGSAKCWGSNSFGQLGDRTTTERASPVDVVGLSDGVSQIEMGRFHTCALADEMKCWGADALGQLGDGINWVIRNVPLPVCAAAPIGCDALLSNVTSFSAGGHTTCAVLSGGALNCWGSNFDGAVGDGTTTGRTTPVGVSELGSGVAEVSAGEFHTCARTLAGNIKCWGANRHGQIGNGISGFDEREITPVDVVGISDATAISAGGSHTCSLTAAAAVKCWGLNDDGQVGDGTDTDRTTPVDVFGLAAGVTAIDAGGDHTCALTDDGGVKCWGDNFFGQLGNGTIAGSATPVDVSGLSSGVQAITAGGWHTCALTNAGGVKCWGNNGNGQLGVTMSGDCPVGGAECNTTPVDVTGLTSGVVAIAAGWAHTCALMAGGAVQCWGDNGNGQLGDRTLVDRLGPVHVQRLPSLALSLAAGGSPTVERGHTCALVQTAELWCWGVNAGGQLGQGIQISSATPLGVVGLKDVSTEPTPTAAEPSITDTPTVLPSSPTPSMPPTLTPTNTPVPPTSTPTNTPVPPTNTPGCPLLVGDANCDSDVTSLDALAVLQFVVGLFDPLPCPVCADANQNGDVNALDAALILQFVAGFIDSLPP